MLLLCVLALVKRLNALRCITRAECAGVAAAEARARQGPVRVCKA